MSTRRTDLPQTLEECHQLIRELDDTIDELRARVAALERELYGAKRERFIGDENEGDGEGDGEGEGESKDESHSQDERESESEGESEGESETESESSEPLDATLSDTELPACEEPAAAPPDESPSSPPNESPSSPPNEAKPKSNKPRRSSAGRRPRVYPESTPREKSYHPLDESQIPAELLHDPRARRFFRFVREEIVLPRRQVRIIEHYQEVIAIDNDDGVSSTMVAATLPEPVIERCVAGNSLLAYLTTSRFADHLPYYREEDILRRSGLSLSRSTQWRWMRKLGSALLPLVTFMRERLRTCSVLGIDETPCPILDPSLPHTRSAYLYAQYGGSAQKTQTSNWQTGWTR